MARNGSGTYSLVSGNPVVTGTSVSSTWANNTLSDIATALTASIAADGQTPVTANLPMNNHKITGLANGTVNGDAFVYGQTLPITADLPMNGHKVTGLANGTVAGDALTYGQALSGTSTPSASSLTNCSVTPASEQWMQVGKTVTVSGKVIVTPNAGGLIVFSLNTPVSYTAIGTGYLAGVGVVQAGTNYSTRQLPYSVSDNASNFAFFEGYAGSDLTASNVYYTYTFRVP
jgi:hypothetical protein